MNLSSLIKSKPNIKPKNNIDPEHFFEKISYQGLFSDFNETLEVDMADLNIEKSFRTNSSLITATNDSTFSSFNVKSDDVLISDSNLNFVSSLLNEEEKNVREIKKNKKKKLILKPLFEKFLNSCDKEEKK